MAKNEKAFRATILDIIIDESQNFIFLLTVHEATTMEHKTNVRDSI